MELHWFAQVKTASLSWTSKDHHTKGNVKIQYSVHTIFAYVRSENVSISEREEDITESPGCHRTQESFHLFTVEC